jgi:isoquinoline 1-oxidoreductase beta subunit
MSTPSNSSRRNFLKQSLIAGGGLILGFNLGSSSKAAAQGIIGNAADTGNAFNALNASASAEFNSYLTISSDGLVTIFSPNPEIGQNIKTSFPMIVADELDVDWSKVKTVQAALDNSKYERQVTGGSGAVPHSWKRLREAGATARQMLMEAAAQRWRVPVTELTTADSMVIHQATGRKLGYGELAIEASKLPVPKDVKLKDPKDFKLIGKAIKNVDNPSIITGKPLYGIDFQREGMYIAMIQRPPAFGMKISSVDADAVKNMPGIVDVVTFKNKVAIVGKSTWQINKARKALKVNYEKEETLESSADHDKLFKELLDSPDAKVQRKDGDVEAAFKKAAKVVKSEYQCPFLPHSPLEPMNFFAHVREDGVELIGPTQTPDRARTAASKITGIPTEKITVEMTRMGGAFGRRLMADFVEEAVEVSQLTKKPIKLMWSREDDMTGGNYRPAVRYRFEAALDKKGNMTAYKLRGVGINSGNPTRENNFPSGSVENLLIDSVEHKSPITTAPWRAPITNFLAFAEQSFIDEVAQAAGKDPVQFRLELLDKAKKSPVGKIGYDADRMKKVTQMVAEKAKWGKKKGVHQGFSVYYSHLSYVAQVGEVAIESGKPVVKKIYAVADCGQVVNLSGARQQVMGGIVDGLGHAMYGNLTFKNGEPEQKNFNNYRLIRIKEVPEVEVHFVDNGIDPTGLGEPALPPTGGAVANAIFKATNKRLYNQPFIEQDIFKGIS